MVVMEGTLSSPTERGVHMRGTRTRRRRPRRRKSGSSRARLVAVAAGGRDRAGDDRHGAFVATVAAVATGARLGWGVGWGVGGVGAFASKT